MAFTQDELDALNTSIARGAREVEYDGQRVRYNSLDEMLRLRSIMERDLATRKETRRVFSTSNGMR